MMFLSQWRLPLLFMISGMGAFFALGRRSTLEFTLERLRRLGIPLIVSIILIIPIQTYLGYIVRGSFTGPYFDFWPSRLLGTLSWQHLWFVAYLLLFAVVFAPLFSYLKTKKMKPLLRICSNKYGIYLLGAPIIAFDAILGNVEEISGAIFNDLHGITRYSTIFFAGYLLASRHDACIATIRNNRRLYALCGLCLFPLALCTYSAWPHSTGGMIVKSLIRTANLWSWCLVCLGYAAAYLNRGGKFLSYVNQAVFPFYILHQSAMMILIYLMRDLPWPFLPKYVAIIVGILLYCGLIYEFGIRPWRWIRPLFGLKSKSN